MKPLQMTTAQFQNFCTKVYELCGINLKKGKEELVHSRLLKRLNALKIDSFEEYFKYLEGDQGVEAVWMIDALTTNKTSFFREIQHFVYLREQILPRCPEKKLRIWSAACSSGEEPYSIAILLAESIPDFKNWDIKILATDISTKVLTQAKAGVYETELLEPVPEECRKKYFEAAPHLGANKWRVKPQIKQMISLARLNLMEQFPMRGPFDIIFCRNAMIYFDKPTQENLVQRFYNLIAPGGHLFVGHSESLTGARHNFTYIQPAIYQK